MLKMLLLISLIPLILYKHCGRKRISKGETIILFLKNPSVASLSRGRFIPVNKMKSLTSKIYRTYLNNYFKDAFEVRLYLLLDFLF